MKNPQWRRPVAYIPDKGFERRRRHRAATYDSMPDSSVDALDDIVETAAATPGGGDALLIGSGTDRLLIGSGTDVLLIGV